jgi:Permuted papain-like amidase enzyme, YaeF/YiiX, C92 family
MRQGKKKRWGMVAGILVLALTVLYIGSRSHRMKPATSVDQSNKEAVHHAVSLLRSGYLVLRMGKGADSYLLSRFNQKDASYSHCGIVMIENGYPFVYHAIGGEDNPDERLRRDSADFFFSPEHNFAIALATFSFDSTQTARLGQVVRAYYAARPLFDLKFDLKSDDKLYCAEFVYKSLNKATENPEFIKTSDHMGLRYVAVDDLFLNPACKIIWQTKFK